MNQVGDKKVIDWIKNKEYSHLTFLDKCWRSDGNELYLGFYYVVLYLKHECLDEVWVEVVSRYNDESSAYCYLGDVVYKIYSSLNELHIPASYYRHAIVSDPNNSDAHWGLFMTDRDTDSCIYSLKSDYESGKFELLGNKIDNLSMHSNLFSTFSYQDWKLIKTIIQDERITSRNNLLVYAYFYLDEVECTLSLLDTVEYVNLDIIKAYFDRGLISKELALSKLYYWHADEFFGDDHESIYYAYVKESKKDKTNPTKSVLIQKAFRAKEYADVITYYNTVSKGDVLFRHDIDARLYYLLALSYLNQNLNTQVLEYVNNQSGSLSNESLSLYQAVKCKHKIGELEQYFAERAHIDSSIDFMGLYQEVTNTLDNSELIKHYLYESLNEELTCLRTKWNGAYYHKQFTEMKVKLSSGNMDSDDFQALHAFGIDCHEFDFVIASVTEFHKKNTPTMSSFNCIAVCHEFKEEFDVAFRYYKLALDLMLSSKDYNDTIISNYVDCAERLPNIDIPKHELGKLRDRFNIELTNRFKWNSFTAKKGRLFKYSPFNVNTIDALTNQYLYLASKQQLNDPIELPTLSKLDSDSLVDPTNYRICSLSNNQNSMLMWSHYAQEHQGIMVEYWFSGEFPSGVGVAKVDYADHFKRNREKDLYVFNQYILTKNKEWEYESEVRIFSNQRETVSFYSFDYPDNDRSKMNARICSITLGCKFPENKKQLIVNLVHLINSNRNSYEPLVTLREAYIPEANSFALEYRDI